jgi:hypothetical protein
MEVYTGMKQVESPIVYRLLHEVLDCAPAIILMIFFCKAKIFPQLEELPRKLLPILQQNESVHSELI